MTSCAHRSNLVPSRRSSEPSTLRDVLLFRGGLARQEAQREETHHGSGVLPQKPVRLKQELVRLKYHVSFCVKVVPVVARMLTEMFSGELSWSTDSIRLQISNPDVKDQTVEQFKEIQRLLQDQNIQGPWTPIMP